MSTTLRITSIQALTSYAELTIHAPDEAAVLLASGCGCDELAAATSPWAVANPDAPAGAVTWSGVIGIEGEMTGDGRLIEANALRWENLPVPLRAAPVDNGAHQGAVVVGRILTVERQAGGLIAATGDFDMGSPEAREAARRVDAGVEAGISMDLDSVSFEVRVAKELLDYELLPPIPEDMNEDAAAEVRVDEDDEGRVLIYEMGADDEVMVTTDARVRAATIVSIPAFSRASITLDAPLGDMEEPEGEMPVMLVAGGYPVSPPAAWFNNPRLTEPTPLTITDDGQIYAHLANWGTCHTAYTGQCVEPPHSASSYSYFATGAVLTAEGAEVPVGQITLDTLHAPDTLSAAATQAHYEHTGRAVADVSVGEDVYGVWVAGALRPGVTPEQVRTLRASPLSGDWRRMRGNLELVAALSVNVQGFPVPRPKGLVASGVMQTLTAAGMLAPSPLGLAVPGGLSADDLRYLKRLADRERRTHADETLGIQTAAGALAARVRATRVHRMASRLRG